MSRRTPAEKSSSTSVVRRVCGGRAVASERATHRVSRGSPTSMCGRVGPSSRGARAVAGWLCHEGGRAHVRALISIGKYGAGARPEEQRTGVTLAVDDVRLGRVRSCTVPRAPGVWCSGVREWCSAGTHSPAVRLFMRPRGRGRRRARCTSQRGRDVSRETVEMARQLRSGVRRPRCPCTPRRVRCSLQGGCLWVRVCEGHEERRIRPCGAEVGEDQGEARRVDALSGRGPAGHRDGTETKGCPVFHVKPSPLAAP